MHAREQALYAALDDMENWLATGVAGSFLHNICKLYGHDLPNVHLTLDIAAHVLLLLVCHADEAQVAIFDATNSTEERRSKLVGTCLTTEDHNAGMVQQCMTAPQLVTLMTSEAMLTCQHELNASQTLLRLLRSI